MKLIFLDIDGTLTPAGSNVPPDSALKAIRQAQDAGHKVFLCSGRNRGMLSPLLTYGFDGYIASSGGYVVCGDRVLYDCPMTREQRDLVMELLKESGVYRTVEAKDASFCDEGISDFLASVGSGGNSELVRWRKALERDLGILPMSRYDGRPIYKAVFMCEREEQLEPARQRLGEAFNFVIQESLTPGCVNGELVNRAFDKGSGVELAARELNVPIQDTIGFGDSMNDLEMIETVGVGVCMGNGCRELKEKSALVCGSVEEDGLAGAFKQLGLC